MAPHALPLRLNLNRGERAQELPTFRSGQAPPGCLWTNVRSPNRSRSRTTEESKDEIVGMDDVDIGLSDFVFDPDEPQDTLYATCALHTKEIVGTDV